MKNKINNLTGMGVALGLTALMALTPGQAIAHPGNGGGGGGGGGGGHHGGGFYSTVSTVSELISDINYVNTAGGAFTINLAAGTTFTLSGPSDELPDIAAGVDLTILGNGDTLTRVDTYDRRTGTVNDLYRLFAVASGAALTVQDLTLNNGLGGVYNQGTLTLVNDTLTYDYQGIYNDSGGTVTVSASTLSNNGPGIYNASGGTVTVNDSSLSNNGGAINSGGTLTINNSILSGNLRYGPASFYDGPGGGAIYITGGTVVVNDSTLTNNTASYFFYEFNAGGYGGGIYVEGGTLTISGSTLSDNDATFSGGGIYNDAGTVYVENYSIIAGNLDGDSVGEDVENLGALYTDGTSVIGILDGNPAM